MHTWGNLALTWWTDILESTWPAESKASNVLALSQVELNAAQPQYLLEGFRRQPQLLHVRPGQTGYFNKPAEDVLGHGVFRKHTTTASMRTREELEQDPSFADTRIICSLFKMSITGT